jgi:hypothetical protein
LLIAKKQLESPPKDANIRTAEAKNPPVHWLWFPLQFSWTPETGGQSSQRLWLFIQWLIGQEALAMSSEEDEAVCLTNNNSLERYSNSIP